MCKRLFVIAIILLCAVSLFAGGGQEAEEQDVLHNTEWTLYITALDVSSLPSSQQILGGIIMQTLVESLKGIEYRVRSTQEIQYYRDLAWARSQSEAARALAAKQNERDLLVFRGDPQWMYQRTLKTYDADIANLEIRLRDVQTTMPFVSAEPKVKISNPVGSWPVPPRIGEEYRFCTNQRADAFLSGDVTEFHGRIYITLKLYTLYTNSYSWEDGVLFSYEDLDNALSELGGRFNAAISGLQPAALIVHVEPEDAMIIIDNFWAGRGEASLRDHVPGVASVAAHADNYVSEQIEVELNAGEIAELSFNLIPLGVSALTVDVPGSPDSSVYLGGLFLGKTPLSVELGGGLSFISVETPTGETGSAIYGEDNIRGNAEFISANNAFAFNTAFPVSPEEKRVAAARNSFYSAYGRFWIALPLSILAISMTNNYVMAFNNNPNPTLEMYENAKSRIYIRNGGYVLIGMAIIDTVYHIVRYLGASGADANPVARVTQPYTEYSDAANIDTEYSQ
jgi:hypothetical protein